ncbi:MAG: hypothetical protein UU08_C0027G0002 [Candidatus Uhrbacteria bacterium GW2011_GWE2_40_58]|nr:MAG: hypothetical protein UT94_C0036G0010 [Candidatus Uhrbacteria bacterium GW2011_GWF2_40_263]KKR67096.1 MAG: hypothetical protein UU08_C0027G0002 [Candidatus Uhrbacteria bacterium GW2011_GWE2_40_58]
MNFFILGNQPTLALAEIASVVGKNHDYSLVTPEVLFLPDDDLNLSALQERLGSVIKTGLLLGELPKWDQQELAQLISAYSQEAPGKEKISFGISVYDVDKTTNNNELHKQLQRLGLETKKLLKETGRPIRYVSSKESVLSSVIVKTNQLLESGGEFVIFLFQNKVLVGQTVAVQNFEAWSERDYGRPARDAKSGMLPPKLARTMINLAGIDPKEKILLDPFCGSGTVLMEAVLLGCKEVIGSDISEKAMADTKKNMNWFSQNFLETRPNLLLFISPAQQLKEQYQTPVDLIITETYLGPPRKGKESENSLKEKMQEIETLVKDSLIELKDLLKNDGVMVFAFPLYLTDNKPIALPLKKLFDQLGFEVLNPIPESSKQLCLSLSPSGGIIYQREHQFIGREIIVFKKKY